MISKQKITKSASKQKVVPITLRKPEGNKEQIFKIAGCLSNSDAAELKAIIEDGCERVDTDAWKNLH